MKFFNPFEDIKVTRNHLPHWQQPGVPYFITFRMADSLPVGMLEELEAERLLWQQNHPPPLSPDEEAEYHKRFSARVDQWLDQGHGSCVLRQTCYRLKIEESLKFFDGQRYEMLSYVIMPNHVHGLLMIHPDWSLEKVIFTWKRRTAGVINESLGVTGPFWQRDYFDRLIRDGDHLRNVIRYIRRNPTKASLKEGEFTLWESALAQAVG
ncbi:transposase [Prosthecobacter sp. SYSU 5D2]|uniref:transposase n=1 Tax=Prosthecobacter sp. SYSU 5D2 TaxID=3134134 RepID=UPI0031FEB02B